MSNVEGKAKETGELKKKIANWEAKIEQMQVEVKKAKAKIESADELIDSAKEKATVNQQGFDDALDVITATIRADVADITRVLG